MRNDIYDKKRTTEAELEEELANIVYLGDLVGDYQVADLWVRKRKAEGYFCNPEENGPITRSRNKFQSLEDEEEEDFPDLYEAVVSEELKKSGMKELPAFIDPEIPIVK